MLRRSVGNVRKYPSWGYGESLESFTSPARLEIQKLSSANNLNNVKPNSEALAGTQAMLEGKLNF
jgi:hypothetical protein